MFMEISLRDNFANLYCWVIVGGEGKIYRHLHFNDSEREKLKMEWKIKGKFVIFIKNLTKLKTAKFSYKFKIFSKNL